MSTPDLDIGVIYTHERDLMPRLLETMAHSGPGLSMRLLLVDNDSNGVPAWRNDFHDTQILKNPRRLSYAANLNRILDASTARYVLLMNTDMYFDRQEPCLARMVEFLDRQPQCGLAGCRLLHADGSEAQAARRFPTPALIAARRCGLERWLRRSVNRHFYAEHAPTDTWLCDWLSGCFLMFRREAIRQIGRFDEGYGKYFEDVDIGLRAHRAGWQVMYYGATYCYHLEQRASRRWFSADAWRHGRAYMHWLGKWGLRVRREKT